MRAINTKLNEISKIFTPVMSAANPSLSGKATISSVLQDVIIGYQPN